ncbi:bifunctional riboflavin kinase/FAD synthetase [Bacillus songklensis]|uniref:Riboflavin biosynthesis protein n=1 Tax=Bacillus songklensis TaxID=1069116 RepID=A0ABV8AX38_9BACI
MVTIEIQHPHHFSREAMSPSVVALGYFDGVHLGHQHVILTAKKIAEQKGLSSAVMTFYPHPSVVLGRDVKHVEMITPLPDKIKQIEELGIDILYLIHFDKDFAGLLPQEFVDQYVIGLNIQHVVAGFDYTYGKLGKGTMETMPFHSRNRFTQTIVEKLTSKHNEKVSSTLIRDCLKEGKVEELPSLLGRHYTVKGKVVHGDKRGRTIGFPTANIELSDQYLIPKVGVYAVEMLVNDTWYEGVCNVGYKPTFHQHLDKPTIEVHLFSFKEDIYDQDVMVKWHKMLRTERKFSGIEELVNQISFDKQQAETYFSLNLRKSLLKSVQNK